MWPDHVMLLIKIDAPIMLSKIFRLIFFSLIFLLVHKHINFAIFSSHKTRIRMAAWIEWMAKVAKLCVITQLFIIPLFLVISALFFLTCALMDEGLTDGNFLATMQHHFDAYCEFVQKIFSSFYIMLTISWAFLLAAIH